MLTLFSPFRAKINHPFIGVDFVVVVVFGGYTYLLPGSPRCEPGEQLVALIEGEIREAHHEACAGTTPCGPLGQQPCRAERGAARRGPEQSRGARRRGPGGP